MHMTARITHGWRMALTGGTVGDIHRPSGEGKFNEIILQVYSSCWLGE